MRKNCLRTSKTVHCIVIPLTGTRYLMRSRWVTVRPVSRCLRHPTVFSHPSDHAKNPDQEAYSISGWGTGLETHRGRGLTRQASPEWEEVQGGRRRIRWWRLGGLPLPASGVGSRYVGRGCPEASAGRAVSCAAETGCSPAGSPCGLPHRQALWSLRWRGVEAPARVWFVLGLSGRSHWGSHARGERVSLEVGRSSRLVEG